MALCGKCRQVAPKASNLWCLGCLAWERIEQELARPWGSAEGRVLGEDLVLGCARALSQVRTLSLVAQAEPNGCAVLPSAPREPTGKGAGGEARPSSDLVAAQSSTAVTPKEEQKIPDPGRSSGVVPVEVSSATTSRPAETPHPEEDEYSYYTEVEESEAASPRFHLEERPALPRKRPQPESKGYGKDSRKSAKKNKKKKKNKRGGRKHQRLGRFVEDPRAAKRVRLSDRELFEDRDW